MNNNSAASEGCQTASSRGKITSKWGALYRNLKSLVFDNDLTAGLESLCKKIWFRREWLLGRHDLNIEDRHCPGDLNFAEVTASDIDSVNRMAEVRKMGRVAFSQRRIAREFLKCLENGQRHFLARNGEEIAGWVRLDPVDERFWATGVPLKEGAMEGKDLIVTRKYRGSGFVAYFLHIGLIELAKREGLPQLICTVRVDNHPSIRIAKHVGYETVGIILDTRRFFKRRFSFVPHCKPPAWQK